MKKHWIIATIVAVFFAGMAMGVHSINASAPAIVSYQGRVFSGGTPFTGTGKFRFALFDGANIVWNSDVGASSAAPTTDISISVNNGLYSVLIGNTVSTAANPYTMAALPASTFANNSPLSLRVYFGDGVTAVTALSPDQNIASVGYAMVAAGVDDGAITTSKLAANAVTASKVADFPKSRVSSSSSQAILNTASLLVTFNSIGYDNDSMYSGVTPNRLTCHTAGYYQLCANISLIGAGAGQAAIVIRVNGAAVAVDTRTTVSGNIEACLATQVFLNANDYIELSVTNSTGSTVTVNAVSPYSPVLMAAKLP